MKTTVEIKETKSHGFTTYRVYVRGVLLNEFLSFEMAATKALLYEQHLYSLEIK